MRPRQRSILSTLLVLTAVGTAGARGQGSHRDYSAREENLVVPPERLEGLELESLNFSRGGRSTAVTGVRGQPLVYYFGGTGGGVFKSANAGNTWTNVTDGFLGTGSVGAIAVAESDNNVVYVGTGSACPRGNISNGDGVYRSTDAGKSWQHVGLDHAGQIGRIRVHPRDENLVYVAALGNLFGPNEERGLFRSRDGGTTWEKVLYLSEKTGFVDLAMDATNPRILYAAAWRAERKPWTLISGSEEGGLFRTTDGGDTWKKLEGGLPHGVVGRVGVAVSPAAPERVWALVEAEGEAGGLYRSDDGGEAWKRLSGDARLRQRPWYYTHIYADPHDANTVYGLNTGLYRSVDGGKTFAEQISVPHGDNHDLWINPDDPRNLINANDGGANVTFDGGDSWSSQMNQPTAEIYRLFVDEQWPYRIYGPQQDNSTISIPSHGRVAWNRLPPDWYAVAGCESGHIAVDPRNPNIAYSGCYGGSIERFDKESGETRQILHYPQLQLGAAPRDLEYRFQWNAPIRLSPHDPDVLYHTSQVVHRTTDGGQNWQVISPDLTTDNEEEQDYTGGPISHDSTGIEVYNTIFAFEESPHRQDELWAGSDDGRLHVSRNGGESWTEVTPEEMPKGGTINQIELSPHDPDRLFVAVYNYRVNDFEPYLFRTNDGGEHWQRLTTGDNGIPPTHFVRTVREDPVLRGLLYVGTEYGLYLSFDDGRHWQSLESKLPVTPVTDLRVHRNDLVVATQGRGFWILRDVEPLRQLLAVEDGESPKLFAPSIAYRGGSDGVRLRYYLPEEPKAPLELSILDGDDVLRTFEWKPKDGESDGKDSEEGNDASGPPLDAKRGINTLRFNLRLEAPKKPKGVVHWGDTPGLSLVPGTYSARLESGEFEETVAFEVALWPALSSSLSDLKEQFTLGREIGSKLQSIYDGIDRIRRLEGQLDGVVKRLEGLDALDDSTKALAEDLESKLKHVLERLTQVKSRSPQDPLNFPPQIDNQYATLYAYVAGGHFKPTTGAQERLADLEPERQQLLDELEAVVDDDLVAFNEVVAAKQLPALVAADPADSKPEGEP